MPQPVDHRITLCVGAKFVHEALVGECILNSQRRAEWPGEERRTHGMSQGPFTADRSPTDAAATNATCEVGRHRVALVAQFSCRRHGRAWLNRLRFITQQHAGDNISRLIVSWAIAPRSDPVLTIPGNDASILGKGGTMLDYTRGAQVLPHHFVLPGKLQ